MADSMDVSGLRLIFYVLISHEVLLNYFLLPVIAYAMI